VNPHAPEVHVAVAFTGATHATQPVPQRAGSVVLAQTPLQSWKPAAQA
jgi:hypothetical protein